MTLPVCMCVCACTHVYACVYVCVHVYACVCVWSNMSEVKYDGIYKKVREVSKLIKLIYQFMPQDYPFNKSTSDKEIWGFKQPNPLS